ncbi:chloride channel protein [Devosia sp.]|uniref:chloride channel protein n=1 Tax=Devosia sp. TaxID=1871048 RepID=UPI001ACAD696|nr:chloride channel protein [Devosia sp.]MBN9335753.1 chloride channel protein [Devosia sp.]
MRGFFRLPKLAGRFGHLRSTLLFVLGSVVGALGGLVVTGVSNLTQVLHHALFGLGAGARLSEQAALGHPLLAMVPAVGGILMGATIVLNRKYRKRQPVDPIEANALHGGRMSMRESAVITSQTVISSSFGASVGLEAGYTQLASAAGSWLATRFHLRRNEVRMLVGCGAAGAIAAAFGAPLTGAFYAFELIVGIYSIGLLAPVVGAALAGNLLAVQLGAVQTHIELGAIAAVGPSDIVAFVALGLIGGSFAVMLMRFVGLVERALVASRLPIWLRPAIGGLAVGGLGLITPQVLSSGHGALHLQFIQSFGLFALVGLLVLKSMASAISLGAGFRGGLFFASLFLGALIGKISAMGASLFGMQVDVGLAAVVGMAAVATGVVGGPLTLTFLILETTNDLAISGAVMVASAISGVLVREMFGFSFSTWRLHLRGESIRAPYDIGRIRSLTVGAIMRRDITTIEKETSLSEFRQRFPLGSTERVVAMDSNGAYEGIVLVAEAYQPWEGEEPLETIEPLLRHKDRFLLAGINASDAAAMFEREGSEELAVVENITSRKVIGLLTEAYLLRRYSAALDQGWKDLTS